MANEIMLRIDKDSMMSINSVEDISFLKVLCISTARLAVMSGRRGGGKLELGSAELKLECQDRETASLLVLSKTVASPSTTSNLSSQDMRAYVCPRIVTREDVLRQTR
jgi:hypothetical protein